MLGLVMPNIAQILAAHGSILVLDAASQRVQIGLIQSGKPTLWHTAETEAGQVVFAGTEALLKQAHLTIDQLGAFVFCEGPGSMLGTRTIAMSIRTWLALKPRPVYRYQSLALAARFAWSKSKLTFGVIADARRETWHLQSIQADGTLLPLQRVPVSELPDSDLLTPEKFRAWAELPRAAAVCSYDLAAILPALTEDDCFVPTTTPDAFQHEAPEYKKWSAQPHSSATITSR